LGRPAPAATSAPRLDQPVINVAEDAKFGKILVDGNGMPLYDCQKDSNAGDTTGQHVGDVWFVVAP
jgi:predicted lipoprotein with Yx(FWY)xxD motif